MIAVNSFFSITLHDCMSTGSRRSQTPDKVGCAIDSAPARNEGYTKLYMDYLYIYNESENNSTI